MTAICAIQANSDLYGLGIRLGFYLSWIASLLATTFALTDSVLDIYDATLVFQAATSIAVFYLTVASPAQAHGIEIVILLFLFFGNIFCVRRRLCESDNSTGWRTLLDLFTRIGPMVYSPWFWVYGLKSDIFLGHQPECTPSLFLFTKVSHEHFNTVRILFAVVAINQSAGTLFTLITNLFMIAKCIKAIGLRSFLSNEFSQTDRDIDRMIDDWYERSIGPKVEAGARAYGRWLARMSFRARQGVGSSRETCDRGDHLESGSVSDEDVARNVRYVEIAGLILQVIIMVFLITGVELMLSWNDISQVYDLRSIGQLVPFTVGVFGVLKVFSDLWLDKKQNKRDVSSVRRGKVDTATSNSEVELNSVSNITKSEASIASQDDSLDV